MSTRLSKVQAAKLKRLLFARVVVGAAVIIATVAVVGAGVLSLRDNSDASSAMRWPFVAAVVLCWLFARIAKSIATVRLSSTR
jgi:hypothetical protein